jgi:hypothetical protein
MQAKEVFRGIARCKIGAILRDILVLVLVNVRNGYLGNST